MVLLFVTEEEVKLEDWEMKKLLENQWGRKDLMESGKEKKKGERDRMTRTSREMQVVKSLASCRGFLDLWP